MTVGVVVCDLWGSGTSVAVRQLAVQVPERLYGRKGPVTKYRHSHVIINGNCMVEDLQARWLHVAPVNLLLRGQGAGGREQGAGNLLATG